MSSKLYEHVQTHTTPQTEAVPGKPMAPNSAGGFTFVLDDWKRLERFLILGSDKGTFYATERKLTRENAAVVERCAALDPRRTVETIAKISEEGRAPKNDPAVFALALCASAKDFPHADRARMVALDALPRVCRTGTHLFAFVAAVNALRGWGAGLRKAVGRWYTSKDAESLGYQLAKYQQRDGWSHRDVLRLCHVREEIRIGDSAEAYAEAQRAMALRWAVGGTAAMGPRTVTRGKGDAAKTKVYAGYTGESVELPRSIQALESLKLATSADVCAERLHEYADKATREMVPTQFLTSPDVWAALLETMPMTAMLRNLATMTKVGLIAPLSAATRTVCERLRDPDRIVKARIHPLAVLVALKTYASGHATKGDSTWTPVQAVVDALNDAYYLAFNAVEPTNKRWVFGLDVSGSMSSPIAGLPISSAEASAALAMVSVRTEPYTFLGGFADCFREIRIGRATRLDDALKCVQMSNFGRTDCSVPVTHALANKIEADVFCVVTDNETYAGAIHPFQALKKYRDATGIAAKMIVVGTTATEFTIADPSDPLSLDVCGFSTDVPSVMADFARN